MAIIGGTDVGTTRADLVFAVVQKVIGAEAKYIGTVANYSSGVPAGSKSVYIPRRGLYSPETKAEDTDLTSQALTFTQDQLTLVHKAVLSEVELIAELQSAVAVEAEVIKESSRSLVKAMDDLIVAQLKLASSAAPDHILDYVDTIGNVISVADIANARKLLNTQYAPMDGRFMAVSAKKEYELLNLANFIQAERYGSNEALVNGEIGKIFGFKVILDPALGDDETLFWHQEAVAFAMQLNPELKAQDHLPGVKKQYLMHTIGGAKVLQAGKWNVFYNGTGS